MHTLQSLGLTSRVLTTNLRPSWKEIKVVQRRKPAVFDDDYLWSVPLHSLQSPQNTTWIKPALLHHMVKLLIRCNSESAIVSSVYNQSSERKPLIKNCAIDFFMFRSVGAKAAVHLQNTTAINIKLEWKSLNALQFFFFFCLMQSKEMSDENEMKELENVQPNTHTVTIFKEGLCV